MSSSRPQRRIRSHITALVVGALVALSALGGGVAWAYWTTSATATGTVTTPSVAVTQQNFPALSRTISYTYSTHTSTGSFTVTNTGTVRGDVVATISGSGIAANLPIKVWPAANNDPATCVDATALPTQAVTSGTYANLTVTYPMLPVGTSQTYCVREIIDRTVNIPPMVSTAGTQSATPQLSVTITAGGWTSAPVVATNTQTAARLYPARDKLVATAGNSTWFQLTSPVNGACADVSGGAGVGSTVIGWSCTGNSNQLWQPIPDPNDSTAFMLRARHAPAGFLGVVGSAPQLVDNSTVTDSKRWRIKQIDGGNYDSGKVMLVSVADGRCLQAPAGTGGAQMTKVNCADATTSITMKRTVLSGDANLKVSFNSRLSALGGVVGPGLALQKWSGTAWVPVSTINTVLATDPSGNTSFTIPASAFAADGITQFRLSYLGDVWGPAYTFSYERKSLLNLGLLIFTYTPKDGLE